MRNIKEIIIHCTATKEGRDFDVNDVRRWHLDRGYQDVGYHYVVKLDGTIQVGRPEDCVGAHCAGKNRQSIGICYVGGLDEKGNPKDTRTDEQKNSLRELVKQLRSKYGNVMVYGHNEFSNKACPCFDVGKEFGWR